MLRPTTGRAGAIGWAGGSGRWRVGGSGRWVGGWVWEGGRAGVGCRVSGAGRRVSGAGRRVSGAGCRYG
jgi:hypothetical protein